MDNNVVISLLWPLTLVTPLLLYLFSRRKLYGRLAGSALHPFNIAGFLMAILSLDFFFLWQSVSSGNYVTFGTYSISSLESVMRGLLIILLYSFAMVVGIGTASLRRARVEAAPEDDNSAVRRQATWATLLIVLGFAAATTGAIVVESLQAGSLFRIAGARQVYFRDNPQVVVFLACIAPAFILFCSQNYRDKRTVFVFALLCAAVLLPSGSRGPIFYLLLGIGIAYFLSGWRISAWLLYAAAPVLVGLLAFLGYLRRSTVYSSFEEYIEQSDVLFSGQDFTMAEPMVVGANFDAVPRYPFESFVAAVMAFVPRSIVPWKPEGPSTVFTRLADPARWNLVRSEWVITGFINMKAEFGTLGGAVAIAVLAYIWARALGRSAQRSPQSLAAALGISSIAIYTFMRGDLYILSFFLWPTALVYLIYRLCRILVGRRSARRSTAMATQGAR